MGQGPRLWNHLGVTLVVAALAGFGMFAIVGSSTRSADAAGSALNATFWVCLIAGVIAYIFRVANHTGKKERAARAAAAASAEEAARTAALLMAAAKEQAEARLAQLRTRLATSAGAAVALFEDLPTQLAAAKRCRGDAATHFQNGAFSPFWDSIEQAYLALGTYQADLQSIAGWSRQYADAVESLSSEDPTAKAAPFPVNVSAVEATRAARAEADLLAKATYEAQRHPVYAQIWEQRRTTAAVVAGFATMSQAVSGMQRAIESRIRDLTDAVRDGDRAMLAATRNVAVDVSAATALNATQVAAAIAAHASDVRALRSRVDKAVWYLNEQHQGDLGLRPWSS